MNDEPNTNEKAGYKGTEIGSRMDCHVRSCISHNVRPCMHVIIHGRTYMAQKWLHDNVSWKTAALRLKIPWTHSVKQDAVQPVLLWFCQWFCDNRFIYFKSPRDRSALEIPLNDCSIIKLSSHAPCKHLVQCASTLCNVQSLQAPCAMCKSSKHGLIWMRLQCRCGQETRRNTQKSTFGPKQPFCMYVLAVWSSCRAPNALS